MSQKNFSIKLVTSAYAAASGASVITGTVAGLLLQRWGFNIDFPSLVGVVWGVSVGLPSMIAAEDFLLYALGKKKSALVHISADVAPGSVSGGRQIPVNYNGRQTTIFASMLEPLVGRSASSKAVPISESIPAMPQSFSVDVSGNSCTLSVSMVDDFLRAAWRRQLAGKPGLARRYHMESRRPRMTETDYKAMIYLLASARGLVVDRGERRSGKLSLPPAAALAHLKGLYGSG